MPLLCAYFVGSILNMTLGLSSLAEECKSIKANKYFWQSRRDNVTYFIFSHFATLAEMQIPACILSNFTMPIYRKYDLTAKNASDSYILELIPKWPILVDISFRILYFYLTFTEQMKRINLFVLQNIMGIECSLNINNQFTENLYIIYSRLDFFLKGELINKSNCNELIGANDFFKMYVNIEFINVRYPAFMCPTVFSRNELTEKITFYDISNSLLNKNQLNIITLQNVSRLNKMNAIKYLEFRLAYETLSERILNKQMFARVNTIKISGVVIRFVNCRIANYTCLF